jgi:hypothetical protein
MKKADLEKGPPFIPALSSAFHGTGGPVARFHAAALMNPWARIAGNEVGRQAKWSPPDYFFAALAGGLSAGASGEATRVALAPVKSISPR